MTRFVLLLVAAALGCGRENRLEKKEETTQKIIENVPLGANTLPKSHEFPEGRSGDIRALFDSGIMSYTIGTVNGDSVTTRLVNPQPVFIGERRFVVSAPPKVHEAIKDVIDSMDKHKAKSVSFDVTLWLVEATDAVKSSVSPELADVLLLLDNLPGYGPRHYTMIDRVSTRTLEGTPSHLVGRLVQSEQTLTAHTDGVELQVTLELNDGPRLESTLQVPLGQAVILGDTTRANANTVLLYVIRVRRLDAPKS